MNDNMRAIREDVIASVIAAKYSINDQIAILRQKDTKPEEYQAFYDFAEEVKRKVTQEYAQQSDNEAMEIPNDTGEKG